MRVFIGDKPTKSGEDCESAAAVSRWDRAHTKDVRKVFEVVRVCAVMFHESTSACAVVRLGMV